MKGSQLEIARAARIRAAVFLACAGKPLRAPGRRIEEIAGVSLNRYPDEILPMELLPQIDGFWFIGWTADFNEIQCSQQTCGKLLIASSQYPLVGWKPIRGLEAAIDAYCK